MMRVLMPAFGGFTCGAERYGESDYSAVAIAGVL